MVGDNAALKITSKSGIVSKTKDSKMRTEAQSTQISKTKHPKLENEAPKTRNHCMLKNYNFKSCMTQTEFVRTSKGPQIHLKSLF